MKMDSCFPPPECFPLFSKRSCLGAACPDPWNAKSVPNRCRWLRKQVAFTFKKGPRGGEENVIFEEEDLSSAQRESSSHHFVRRPPAKTAALPPFAAPPMRAVDV